MDSKGRQTTQNQSSTWRFNRDKEDIELPKYTYVNKLNFTCDLPW